MDITGGGRLDMELLRCKFNDLERFAFEVDLVCIRESEDETAKCTMAEK